MNDPRDDQPSTEPSVAPHEASAEEPAHAERPAEQPAPRPNAADERARAERKDEQPAGDETPLTMHDGQVILVRRRRAPALGFWVVTALVVGFVAGVVTGFAAGIRVFGDLVYFGVTGVLIVGFPLALIAALVDWYAERRRRRGRR